MGFIEELTKASPVLGLIGVIVWMFLRHAQTEGRMNRQAIENLTRTVQDFYSKMFELQTATNDIIKEQTRSQSEHTEVVREFRHVIENCTRRHG